MDVSLTNRQLSDATGWSHGQIRRWVVAFLPPDPKVGQFAGVSRGHSVDEAFRVVTGGRLVFEHGLTIRDARTVLEEFVRLLMKRRWMPSDLMSGKDGTNLRPTILRFGKTHKGTFHYKLKTVWHQRMIFHPAAGKELHEERFDIEDFGDRRSWNRFPGEISLDGSVSGFVDDVKEYLAEHEEHTNPSPKELGSIRMFHEEKR